MFPGTYSGGRGGRGGVEGAGLLELQCTFFGGILDGRNCCWLVILGSGCVEIC